MMRNLLKNLNIIWQPPIYRHPPPFSSKNFQTPPIPINSEKVRPPPPPVIYEGGRGVQTMNNKKNEKIVKKTYFK